MQAIHRGVVRLGVVGLLGLIASAAQAKTLFVVTNNSLSQSPYTNWVMAATNIQTAVNTAANGDTIMVGPGDYHLTSEVSITKSLFLRSLDGAQSTLLNGQHMCRCLYLLNTNAEADGFTIINGYITNGYGGGASLLSSSRLLNCMIISNRENSSGGAGGGGLMLNGPALVSNCIIRFNQANNDGGGVMLYSGGNASIQNTVMEENLAGDQGGGLYLYGTGQVEHCVIGNNTASNSGGGAYFNNGGRIQNTVLFNNTARGSGGGVFFNNRGFMDHATVVSNFSQSTAGGIFFNGSGMACRNCIVYYNIAALSDGNYSLPPVGAMNFCCTTSLPPSGVGNTDQAPRFLSEFRLAGGSSCIDQGTNLTEITEDFFGRQRPMDGNLDGVATADIGSYEYALELRAQAVSNHIIQFNFDFLPLLTYELQVSTNLNTQIWSTIGSYIWVLSPDPGIRTTNVPMPLVTSYYRLRVD